MRPALAWLACAAWLAAAWAPRAAADAPRPAVEAARKPAADRLQLERSAITGNSELPKVMNIVPWKAAEPPAGPDRPLDSLIEDVLRPIDRDEFRRRLGYEADLLETVSPSTPQSNVHTDPGAIRP